MGTLVTVIGTNLNNLSNFSVGGVPAITISNDGNNLVGMVMPGAATGAVTVVTNGGMATGNSNFTVTPTPFFVPELFGLSLEVNWWEVVILVPHSKVFLFRFQQMAILSLLEEIMIILTKVLPGFGLAQVIHGHNRNKLVGTGNVGAAHQGASVAVSADGNTAIVGGAVDNNYQGAIWVLPVQQESGLRKVVN
ncbi:MAG: hypothetical protein IPP46_12490 [Bacteroidetes bacterium]|nr:hypothetical protein [Bacteroidota bacterium]